MPDAPPPAPQAEFEAMLRRYVAKTALRYAPVIAGGVLLIAVLLLVPTTQPASSSFSGGLAAQGGAGSGSGSGAGGAGTGASAGGAANPSAGLGGSGGGGGLTASGGGGAGFTTSGGGGAVTGGGVSGGGGSAPSSNGSGGGVSKTGVTCTNGARQFSWSGHSPYCVAAFNGNNGGATGQGVTASTITLTFRIPASVDDQAIAAAAGAANVNYPAMIADMQTYINFFNKQFELYGRHVVLKAFNGQGDYIQEDQGQDLPAAQADAVSVHDMGGFGDVTFSLGSSQAYEQDLADEHVMSFSSVGQPESWYQQYAPYEWSVQGAGGTTGIQESAAVVCRRLAGLPAVFAGDPLLTKATRKFGIIYPENPNYAAEVAQYKQLLAGCHVTAAPIEAYAINVAQFPTEAAEIMAAMRAANVTTVLCACDPIVLIFLTDASNGQGYHPEWYSPNYGDPVAQDYNQSVWAHAIVGGPLIGPPTQSEAYKVYEMANPGHQPAEGGSTSPPYFYVPYYSVLHVFEALQAAGPNLTASTFEQGMFSLPASVGVDPEGGAWKFGNQVYDPVVSFGLSWWNQSATSDFDNKPGTWIPCDSGQVYNVDNLAALGGPGTQLNCFGH